ncbi:hypothetical protein L9F63_008964 [Diploptera punctata]|uniref:Uncharacterized protein n=1 Tax=Diploptera punctata TaxID=6984 RepID=A0AAD7Z520_DIPPU|nr:hypothetical protein L9F63_008964 [Diploptera punctata]
MALLRQPDQLVNLSLQTLCKYICTLIDNSSSIKDTCTYLEHLFRDGVPQSMADIVTENLLWALDAKLTYVDKSLSKLFDIVIMPTVTRLDFCLHSLHQVPYKAFYYHWNGHIIPEVLQRLHVLQNLRVLRIFHTFDGKYTFPSSLVEFTYHNNCDKKILKQLSKCCKDLRKLDLYNSTSIGDSSVEFILKFKSLQHIDLFGTYINEKGMTELLEKLAKNKCKENVPPLKSFGCSNLTSLQFEMLMNNFSQLTSLKFARNTRCEFDLLENLKFLKSFSITDVSARDLYKIIKSVGNQLVLLHFGCDEEFDLRKLAAECITIECLHVNSATRYINVPDVKEMKRLPGLKLVKCLYANLYNSPEATCCLISTCQDVEVLEVNTDTDGCLIAETILNNPMTSLKELNWWCSGDVRDVTLKVVQHCTNLQVLRGYYVWKRRGNIKNDIPVDRNIDWFRFL